MTIEPIVFFLLAISLIALAIALASVVISYSNMIKKFHSLRKEEEDLKAHERKKAQAIIIQANHINDSFKNSFQQQLNSVANKQVKFFESSSVELMDILQKELIHLKDKNIKMIKNISKKVERDTISELKDFKEIMRKETIESQKIVGAKIEEDYKKVLKEIDDYKKEKLKNAEDHIYAVLQEISKLVLGKSISIEEHEQLIIDALNKAKEEKAIG